MSTPPEGYWESLTTADWKRLLDGLESYRGPSLFSRLFPSGAKETVYTVPVGSMAHLELPYHELDTYSLILGNMTIRTFIDEHGELGRETLNPVDIQRASACQGESLEQLAQGCAMVPGVESQQTLKK